MTGRTVAPLRHPENDRACWFGVAPSAIEPANRPAPAVEHARRSGAEPLFEFSVLAARCTFSIAAGGFAARLVWCRF